MTRLGWLITLVAVACVAGVGIAGYVFYKYRLRVSPPPRSIHDGSENAEITVITGCFCLQSYMDSEIMSIMSQYMPLDSQNNENQPLRQHDSEALR